uniref:Uncharacterized protein n=1 Tax=Cacopsylla melanoneura TaxID=428564 RepID=A0A8D9EHD0_9HEMI
MNISPSRSLGWRRHLSVEVMYIFSFRPLWPLWRRTLRFKTMNIVIIFVLGFWGILRFKVMYVFLSFPSVGRGFLCFQIMYGLVRLTVGVFGPFNAFVEVTSFSVHIRLIFVWALKRKRNFFIIFIVVI